MKGNTVSESDRIFSIDESDVCGIVEDNFSHIDWNENDWAYGCVFLGKGLDIQTRNQDCYTKCASTEGKCLEFHSFFLSSNKRIHSTQVALILHGTTEFV